MTRRSCHETVGNCGTGVRNRRSRVYIHPVTGVAGGPGGAQATTSRRALKHVIVREHVRDVVRDAEPGTPAPSERELVARFGVARMTVRQAVDALVAEGVLERHPGRGTFVAVRREPQQRVIGYTDEARRAGVNATSRTLVTRLIQTSPALGQLFGDSAGERLLQWERLRLSDGNVTALQMVYLNVEAVPGWPIDSPPASLYDELQARGLRPDGCEDVLKPGEATAHEAQLLEIAPGTAVLRQQRRSLAGERTLEVSSAVHRIDRFRLRFHAGT